MPCARNYPHWLGAGHCTYAVRPKLPPNLKGIWVGGKVQGRAQNKEGNPLLLPSEPAPTRCLPSGCLLECAVVCGCSAPEQIEGGNHKQTRSKTLLSENKAIIPAGLTTYFHKRALRHTNQTNRRSHSSSTQTHHVRVVDIYSTLCIYQNAKIQNLDNPVSITHFSFPVFRRLLGKCTC